MPRRKIIPTNTSFELGHSRAHDIPSKREEQTLAKWFLVSLPTIIVLAIVIGVYTSL